MRYIPTQNEIIEINEASEDERLHYFLTRTIESEEIWGIGDHNNWLLKEIDDRLILPVWPYERLARECLFSYDEDKIPDAISLEQFVYHVLPTMKQQNINVEVLPTKIQTGKIIVAQEIMSLFESLMDSGEYYLEG